MQQIGKNYFLVHKKAALLSRIVPAKLKTFEKTKNGVEAIFQPIGQAKVEVKATEYFIFANQEEAIKQLEK